MFKYVHYEGVELASYEVDGYAYADMRGILELIIPGSWSDYSQVINSGDDLIEDLDIIIVDNVCLVPVRNISKWLFSFSLNKMSDGLKNRFRLFRRDLENSFRVAWALEVDLITVRPGASEFTGQPLSLSMWDLTNVFSNFEVPDSVLEGCDREGRIYGPLHYIQLVAASTECGSRGSLLANQIQYIEDLPDGESIMEGIGNSLIRIGIPEPEGYLDEYLDTLNSVISNLATHYIGSYDAK